MKVPSLIFSSPLFLAVMAEMSFSKFSLSLSALFSTRVSTWFEMPICEVLGMIENHEVKWYEECGLPKAHPR